MPNANEQVRFIGCTSESYAALGVYNQNTLYFCTDTQQIYLGSKEYTKSVVMLDSQPTSTTVGENGRLYVYNGNIYMCQVKGYSYRWVRVANVNDDNGTVYSITAGTGLSGGTITEAGTISHAVPNGAKVVSDNIVDDNPNFGESFKIVGVQTDEFGHVTSVNLHDITLPNETNLSLSSTTGTTETLEGQATFEVVSEVTTGPGSHDIKVTRKSYKLPPASENITYTVEPGDKSGAVKLIGSDGSITEAIVKDWDTIAKITDITSIFRYKGKVATKTDLPTTGAVGDVWMVEADHTEYIYLGETEGWEEFGPEIDLSPYALTDEVIQRVKGSTGKVPLFTADGTLASTGFALLANVPSDAVFTDTIYTHPKFTPHGLGLYKVQIDEEGHVASATLVTKTDITALGIPSENTDTHVKTNPTTVNRIYVTGSASKDESTEELQLNPKVFIDGDGSLTAPTIHGTADSAITATSATTADSATTDSEGNVIKDTYATKDEVVNHSTVWEVI